MRSIAVLITCFNRKNDTLKCLERLHEIESSVHTYLVDDASSDGTAESVSKLFPDVNLIDGSGDLFWNRGMHLAWQEASKNDYDYYLWLNDDIILYDNFLAELLECSDIQKGISVISGIIESEDRLEILYGGSDSNKKLLEPTGYMQEITYLNGNVVLVPKAVYDILGNLDPTYHHDMGDVDYGFRALEHNIPVYSTRCPIGSGKKNFICRERKNNTTLIKRFRNLYSPLGSSPKLNFYFRIKYKSVFNAIIYFVFQHFLNIIPDRINDSIFGNKYK